MSRLENMPSKIEAARLTAGTGAASRKRLAKKNAESAVALVEKIAKAQNFQDVFGLQARFAQEQMQAYAAQTQELQKLIGETLQKLQHG